MLSLYEIRFLRRYYGKRERREVKSHFRHLGAYYDHSSKYGEILGVQNVLQVDKYTKINNFK